MEPSFFIYLVSIQVLVLLKKYIFLKFNEGRSRASYPYRVTRPS